MTSQEARKLPDEVRRTRGRIQVAMRERQKVVSTALDSGISATADGVAHGPLAAERQPEMMFPMDGTPEEDAALNRVREADRSIEDSKRRLRAAVAAALESGVSAMQIASTLGVSRSRVYQIKDGK